MILPEWTYTKGLVQVNGKWPVFPSVFRVSYTKGLVQVKNGLTRTLLFALFILPGSSLTRRYTIEGSYAFHMGGISSPSLECDHHVTKPELSGSLTHV